MDDLQFVEGATSVQVAHATELHGFPPSTCAGTPDLAGVVLSLIKRLTKSAPEQLPSSVKYFWPLRHSLQKKEIVPGPFSELIATAAEKVTKRWTTNL